MQVTEADEQNGRELKWRRALALLAEGRQLTRFDVEPHGDHCFNTSVSVISKKGVEISRKPIVIDGRFGRFRCRLYWLEAEQIECALRLLGIKR
jgi:hypothetical protein